VKIIVRHGINNNLIEDAQVIINHTTEQTSSSAVLTNSDGEALIPISKNGEYDVQVTLQGYFNATSVLTIDCDTSNCPCSPEHAVSLAPTPSKGEVIIIMNWDEKPKDLDIHVLLSNANTKTTCHTSYEENGCTGVSLDLDSYDGGLEGAETITFDNSTTQGSSSIYMIYVHNFEDSPSATLGESNVRLKIASSINIPEITMDTSSYTNERFWLAGCLRFQSGYPEWKSKNLYYTESPKVHSKTACNSAFDK